MAKLRENIEPGIDQPAPARNDKRKRARVVVYLNDEGKPDWDSVPEDQKSKLGLAGAEPAPVEPPAEVAPEMVGLLLQTMTSIEAALVAPRIGIDQSEALAALTPAPPVQAGLCQAGARVLNKYAGAMGRWQDEIVLATLIVTWQASAFAQMRAIAAERAPKPEPAPPSREQRETAQVVKEAVPPVAPKPEAKAEEEPIAIDIFGGR